MNILQEKRDHKGLFYIEENGVCLAKMKYKMNDENKMIIEHTEVSEQLKGKGIGKQLVDYAVDYARKNNLKIIPECPFAKSVFERFKGYEDVL